jgi:hypothetical protein
MGSYGFNGKCNIYGRIPRQSQIDVTQQPPPACSDARFGF